MAAQNVGADPEIAKSFKPLLGVVQSSCGDQYVGPPNQDYMKSLVALQIALGQITSSDPNDPNINQAASSVSAAKLTTAQMAQNFGVDPIAGTVQTLMEEPIAYVEALIKGGGVAALNKVGKDRLVFQLRSPVADFDDPSQWHEEAGIWVHRGAGFLSYKLVPNGVFTFTVDLLKGGGFFRGSRVRWAVNYIDSQNYALFEVDSKNFWARVVVRGKTFQRTHVSLDLSDQMTLTVQLDVNPQHLVQKILIGGKWTTVDTWSELGRNFSDGKFGFLVQGNDEIGLREFSVVGVRPQ